MNSIPTIRAVDSLQEAEVYLVREAWCGYVGAKDILATLRSEDGDKPSSEGMRWLQAALKRGGEASGFAQRLAQNFGLDLGTDLK